MHDSHEEGYRYQRPQACIDELRADLRYYQDTFCEGFCDDVPPGFTNPEMEFDCSGCKARATLEKTKP